MFLLRYLSDLELRHVINTAATKRERLRHRGEYIRDEQRKFIKYNHLVVNLLAFSQQLVGGPSGFRDPTVDSCLQVGVVQMHVHASYRRDFEGGKV